MASAEKKQHNFKVGDIVLDNYGKEGCSEGIICTCPNPDMMSFKTRQEIMTVRFGNTELNLSDFADGALVLKSPSEK